MTQTKNIIIPDIDELTKEQLETLTTILDSLPLSYEIWIKEEGFY